MRFTIAKKTIAAALNAAKSMADTSPKTSMPILGSVVIRAASDGSIKTMSTDMTVSLSETLTGEVAASGAVAASVKRLAEIVGVLPDVDLEISSLDNFWLRIKAGKSEFKLMGMPETDFPVLPQVHEKSTRFSIDGSAVLDLFDRVGYAISRDTARVNLNGALLESDGVTVRIVATDGHRLSTYKRPLEWPSLPHGIIVPLAGIEAMVPILKRGGDVELAIDPEALGHQRNLFVVTPTFTFSTRLWNIMFPPYNQVIPSTHKREVQVNKSEFEGALRRAVVMAPEKTATVRLTFQRDAIEIDSDNPDLGVAHHEVAATMSMGEPMMAGFNARYLLEASSKIDGDVLTLQGNHELDPIVLVNEYATSVVMPMRI